jgi:hypothetical protein
LKPSPNQGFLQLDGLSGKAFDDLRPGSRAKETEKIFKVSFRSQMRFSPHLPVNTGGAHKQLVSRAHLCQS